MPHCFEVKTNKYDILMELLDSLKKKVEAASAELINPIEKKTKRMSKKDSLATSLYQDKEIENLINLALEDEELTEKEKQVLFKKAQAKGIDLDVFEMYLDTRLARVSKKKKQDNNESTMPKSAPNTQTGCNVRKCPNCGGIVPAFATNCPDCGYDMGGVGVSSSIAKELSQKIDKIYAEADAQKENIRLSGKLSQRRPLLGGDSALELQIKNIDCQTERRINSLISHFPIPVAKADLFEFIVMMDTNHDKASNKKFNEALDKAEMLYPTDPLFAKFIQDRRIMREKVQKREEEMRKREEERERQIAKRERNTRLSTLVSFLLATTAVTLEWVFLNWHWGWILFVSIITFPVAFIIINLLLSKIIDADSIFY